MKNLIYCYILLFVMFANLVSSCRDKELEKKTNASEFVPDSALFAKEHPSPTIVRGFMVSEVNDQQNFNDAKNWGANVVRIQIFPGRYATSKGLDIWEALPVYLDRVEGQVKLAKQAGLKVVIDLHEAPFQNIKSQEAEFWNRTDLEEKFCRVWTEIAKRLLPYKGTIWGYDLYNEPVDNSQFPEPPHQWYPLAIKIIIAIRKIDKETWIIFEPGPWGLAHRFNTLKPLPDLHVIYSLHFYYPQEAFTHQGVNPPSGLNLEEAKKLINKPYPATIDGILWDKDRLAQELKRVDEFQSRWKVPIYVGEFSVVRWAPKDDAVRWLKDATDLFESRGWSWSYHAFREWNGWSLEHDENFWMTGMPNPQPVTYETDRVKVIKKAFTKN